ncbi:NUDIX domain-containing protein [Nocardia colli]|uniref:NUDIX domain-containing protein n=1 Tax=Nocardia colli TaxID=2545717 RepID=UPI001CC7A4DD|nr:NUDIX domain-containing protein [Nocardia colli]
MTGSGYVPQLYSVSVKGVVVRGGRVLLLKNERGEWELPGGRIEVDESPEECVTREIAEETRWLLLPGQFSIRGSTTSHRLRGTFLS